jgi:hypothetical protein
MRKLVISRFRNGGTKMRMRFRTILVVVFAVLAACSTGREDRDGCKAGDCAEQDHVSPGKLLSGTGP